MKTLLLILTFCVTSVNALASDASAQEPARKVWTDAEIKKVMNERTARRFKKMLDREKVPEAYTYDRNPTKLTKINRAVRKRLTWLDVDDIYMTKKDSNYRITQPIDNGYLFQSYDDSELPVILITNRVGIEQDGIEAVTDLVRYKGLTRYTTVLGTQKQAILLQDVWSGVSAYDISVEMSSEDAMKLNRIDQRPLFD